MVSSRRSGQTDLDGVFPLQFVLVQSSDLLRWLLKLMQGTLSCSKSPPVLCQIQQSRTILSNVSGLPVHPLPQQCLRQLLWLLELPGGQVRRKLDRSPFTASQRFLLSRKTTVLSFGSQLPYLPNAGCCVLLPPALLSGQGLEAVLHLM